MKGKDGFEATPIIQLELTRARKKAEKARAIADLFQSDRRLEKELEKTVQQLAAGKKPEATSFDPVKNYASLNAQPTIVPSRVPVVGAEVYGYIPPGSVEITPDVTAIFDQTPQPTADGPFEYILRMSMNATEPTDMMNVQMTVHDDAGICRLNQNDVKRQRRTIRKCRSGEII